MKIKTMTWTLAAAVASAGFAHADDEALARALEARIAQLEQSSAGTTMARPEKFRINGFMSAGFGHANSGNFRYDNGLYEEVTHKADSVVGIQLDATVNEKTNAVVQLAARGPSDFGVRSEWAYIGYRPGDSTEVRAGRLRTSFFLLSEFLEVGYAYPWARPPAEVYREAFPSSYDGISVLQKFSTGSWEHDVHFNWGTTGAPETATTKFDSHNSLGLGISSSSGNWQFGAKISGGEITASNPLFDAFSAAGLVKPVLGEKALYSAIGGQYDNGSLLVMAEHTNIDLNGVLPDTQASYVTLGYRFGKVTPHLTWSTATISDQADRAPLLALVQDDHTGNANGLPDLCSFINPNPATSLCMRIVPNTMGVPGATTLGIPFLPDTLARALESAQDSVTLGVRYDLRPNMALKLDWTRVLDTHNTFGLLTAADGNLFYNAAGAPLARPSDEFDVLRFVVDVTF